MKKFIIGFFLGSIISSVILVAMFFICQRAFGFIPPFCEDTSEKQAQDGGCKNINSDVNEYGLLKVILLYKGSPAKAVEVDLAKTPGPDNYCYEKTDENGFVEFSNVPVGTYYVYLNMTDFPEEYGIPSAQEQVTIEKDDTLEVTIELTDYQK